MKESNNKDKIDFAELGRSYTPAQAAEYLGHVKVSTLATWRTNKPRKLPFHRTGEKGGRVLYFQKHLDEFMTRNLHGV